MSRRLDVSGLPFAFRLWPFALILTLSCVSVPIHRQVSEGGTGAYEAALAAYEDGFVVAWYDTRAGNPEIYMRVVDEAGRPAGPERRLTRTPEASYEASVDRLGVDIAIAWYEVDRERKAATAMLGRFGRDGAERWVRPLAPRTRNPVIRARGAAIACAWIQAADDGSEAVWAGWFDADGEALDAPVRLGDASRDTWNVNLALEASGVAWAVWDVSANVTASEIVAARVLDGQVRAERLTRDDGHASKYPDLALAADGRFALTWFDRRDGNEEVYLAVGAAGGPRAGIEDRALRVTRSRGESIGAYVAWNGDRVGLAWSDTVDEPVPQLDIFFAAFDERASRLGPVRRITRTRASSLVPAIRPWRDGFALAWNEYAPARAVHEGTSEVAFALVP